MKHNIRNYVIRWRMATPVKVTACILTLAITVLEILFHMFDLDNIGQGHQVQRAQ